MNTVNALFTSYAYNREFEYMIELCEEVLERIYGIRSSNRTYDGDIIYGFLVLAYGDYGTSPRSGWIEDYKEEIISTIKDLIEVYKRLREEENEHSYNTL